MDKIENEIKHIINNKIVYLSGTISPSPKSPNELESVESAVNYYLENEIDELIIQPKYMGSRCSIMLNFKDINLSYGITRNGYRLKLDLSNIYKTLHDKYSPFVSSDTIWILFDGELLPWNAMGNSLINKEFNSFSDCINNELNYLNDQNFYELFDKTKKDLDEDTIREIGSGSKEELLQKYDHRTYSKLKCLVQLLNYDFEEEKQKTGLEMFNKQMELYGTTSDLNYKPFNILKIIQESEIENQQREFINFTMKEVCEFLGEPYLYIKLKVLNEYIPVEIKDNQFSVFNTHDFLTLIENFYKELVIQGLEGIVIKTNTYQKVVPYMKVRNPNYLHIIYGYDYLLPKKYNHLIKKKHIDKKVQLSTYQYKLGQKLLSIPYNEFNMENQQLKDLLRQLLTSLDKEKELDSRL